MLVGFAILLALFVIWFDRNRASSIDGESTRSRSRTPWLGDLVALCLIGAAYYPLRSLLAAWGALPGYLPGDARTHAAVAAQLFGEALSTGWTDRYVGGFPLALHYPMIGWLLTGLPIKLGVESTRAVYVACTCAVVSTSLVTYAVARFNAVRVAPSAVAALVLAWVSPLNSFVGGYETFFMTGLVSQVMVMPLLVVWIALALGRGTAVSAALFAALTYLAHPQVAICATLILGWCVAATACRQLALRFALSSGFALLVAILIYGSAAVNFTVPFGWPQGPTWMRSGFGPDRLGAWFLDGDLLDHRRPLVLTALWAASLLLSIGRWRHPAARVVVVASLGTLLGCLVGPWVASSGALGSRLLSVVQPLRMMALLPVAVAASSLVALQLREHAISRFVAAIRRLLRVPARLDGGVLKSALLSIFAVPAALTLHDSRQSAVRQWIAELGDASGTFPCGKGGPTAAEWAELRATLSSLTGSRLWFDDAPDTVLTRCAQNAGLERQTRVALANTRGVGSHVGVLTSANAYLNPGLPGWSGRAEALGIRFVLLNSALGDDARESFALVASYGPLVLYRRTAGSDLFGVGCVRERWSGRNNALATALQAGFQQAGPGVGPLDREQWIALVSSGDTFSRWPVDDSCNKEQASLENESHSVGKHAVTATAAAPVDLVLRVTASPTWQVSVDGVVVVPELVAPGYMSVRLEPGTHRVAMHHEYRPSTRIGFGLVLSCALVQALLGIERWRRVTRCYAN